jgi:hypothetical protein
LDPVVRTNESALAHHEAGHAVCAWALDYPIKSVSVIPDPEHNRAGGLLSVLPSREMVWRAVQGDLTAVHALQVLYAGSVAEARHQGLEVDAVWMSTGSTYDRLEALRIVGDLMVVSPLAALIWNSAKSLAYRRVHERWTMVEAAARELRIQRVLTPGAVAEIAQRLGETPDRS